MLISMHVLAMALGVDWILCYFYNMDQPMEHDDDLSPSSFRKQLLLNYFSGFFPE